MKPDEEIMEILEAFDLCGTLRAAAELCSCSPNTVARYVQLRDAGLTRVGQLHRASVADSFSDKVEEWVELSKGKIRADVAHKKLMAMGYQGSERTTRRIVAKAKADYRQGKIRIYRPWVPEPGRWFQFDWADGPQVQQRETSLFCAWLAWSRFRVVLPTWDRTLPQVAASIDATLRAFGGAPTFALTDNEKTVTVEHIARIPVRHPEIVRMGRHYGVTIATCVPADPESKGGSEATVRIAKADLVPTQSNLLTEYSSFAELQEACSMFTQQINARVHRETGKTPIEMLALERDHLHPIPEQPYMLALGETRRASWSSTISFRGVRYGATPACRPKRLGASTRRRVGDRLG